MPTTESRGTSRLQVVPLSAGGSGQHATSARAEEAWVKEHVLLLTFAPVHKEVFGIAICTAAAVVQPASRATGRCRIRSLSDASYRVAARLDSVTT